MVRATAAPLNTTAGIRLQAEGLEGARQEAIFERIVEDQLGR